MNANTTKALFKDALYQVFDNRVFRILVVIVACFVLPTFLIAAREDELVVLFGWKRYFYEDIFASFGVPYPGLQGANTKLIQIVQTLLVDQLAGTFGIIFAVAATAFFMPRMLEKGAADTVFSKPVSRLALMLSRYVSGLLFVAILGILLVGGMHVGLLVNSGYSDVGSLWAVLTLIYLFAILHAFSIVVGVVMRSTVAAILTTLVFFAFTGCVHMGWKAKDNFLETRNTKIAAVAAADDSLGGESASKKPDEIEQIDRLKQGFFTFLDVMHFTLPKTSDASLIAQKLRRTVENRNVPFTHEGTGLKVLVLPEGFEHAPLPSDDSHTVVVWTHAGPGGTPNARIALRHWDYDDPTSKDEKKGLHARLETDPAVGKTVTDERGRIAGGRIEWVNWLEQRPEDVWRHRTGFFGYVWVLEIEGEQTWLDAPAQVESLKQFQASIGYDNEQGNHGAFSAYERKLSWTGPLKYNLTFSIASSLAFVVAVLALGWWRLSRIDF
jgi:ABC-type transport system involved in multi-copper enzyme maturation permease subunit